MNRNTKATILGQGRKEGERERGEREIGGGGD
jgi:hypothetical protein